MRCRMIMAAVFLPIFLLTSCGGSDNVAKTESGFQPKPFPYLTRVPSALTDPLSQSKFMHNHFWDTFVTTQYCSYPSDSTMLNGVKMDEVRKAFATFVMSVGGLPTMKLAQEAVSSMYDNFESVEQKDTSSNLYERMCEIAEYYLYDPNSPYRNEDLYLPFIEKMAASKYQPDELKPGYEFTVKMCSLNQAGTPVADFSFTDLKGRKHKLSEVKADYTLLFFSNPGCPSCREITQSIEDSVIIQSEIESGKLAVVNIYIDRELDKWREYAVDYPDNWISGYDHNYIIRDDILYNIRAIPSLYVLDKEKNVIFKDAPESAVLNYLNRI